MTYDEYQPAKLWRIESRTFVAGLTVRHGMVVGAAPILKRFIGKSWNEVKITMKERGWHGEPLSGLKE
jgi:hypothetical protein